MERTYIEQRPCYLLTCVCVVNVKCKPLVAPQDMMDESESEFLHTGIIYEWKLCSVSVCVVLIESI